MPPSQVQRPPGAVAASLVASVGEYRIRLPCVAAVARDVDVAIVVDDPGVTRVDTVHCRERVEVGEVRKRTTLSHVAPASVVRKPRPNEPTA